MRPSNQGQPTNASYDGTYESHNRQSRTTNETRQSYTGTQQPYGVSSPGYQPNGRQSYTGQTQQSTPSQRPSYTGAAGGQNSQRPSYTGAQSAGGFSQPVGRQSETGAQQSNRPSFAGATDVAPSQRPSYAGQQQSNQLAPVNAPAQQFNQPVGKDVGAPDGLYAQPRQHFSIEASTPLAQHALPPTQTYKYPCTTIPLTQKSKPWASGFHPSLIVVGTIFLGMVIVDIIYFVYRIRYTLKTPTNPRDATGSSYSISAYPIISIVIELLCAMAMGLYAVSKVFYPKVAWKPNAEQRALAAKAPVNVHICVCCCGEETEEVEVTMVKAAECLLYAGRMGYVNMECSGIWLCDDTGPSKKASDSAQAGTQERVQSDYEAVLPSSIRLNGKARPLKSAEIALGKQNLAKLMHGGKGKLPKQQQRMKLMMDLASNPKFDSVNFVHRYRDDPVRVKEYRKFVNGKPMDNHKSCNLNATFRLMWPDQNPEQNFVRPKGPPWGSADSGLSENDIIVVLDADQECHIDFLTEVLPCFKAGVKEDNLVLVQTPQVFKGVNYTIDILNHVNVEFWSTMMVSYNTTGFISCAGTNFAIKAAALRHLGPDPFPTHTVTEDFAMGMRLRAQKPRFTGIYLPVEYVSGGAPDTIRKAYRQRSRWSKGAWEMLFSKESALWYRRKSGPNNDGRNALSFRDRISFVAPVFNVVVNATATPFLCFVPMFYILGGHFPASMTQATISLLITTLCFNLFFKYYGRPSVGVEHIIWKKSRPDPNGDVQFMAKVEAFDEDTKDGQMRVYKPRRETTSWFGYLMSEWNADQNIRCFWWLFMKVAVNSILVKLRFKARSGFKSTAGPAGEFFEGFMDVFPLTLLMLLLWACIVWGFLQFSLGATLIGPLGISMVWALYQSLPFFNQLLYVVCRVRHEPENIGCCGCYEHFGRKLFQILYVSSFFITWACLIIAAVLALKTPKAAFTQHSLQNPTGITILYINPKQVVKCLGHSGYSIDPSTGLCAAGGGGYNQ